MINYLKNLYKPFRSAIFILAITTGCRDEEVLVKTNIFTYSDVKLLFNEIGSDSEKVSIVSLKNISIGFQLAGDSIGETMVPFTRCKGFCCAVERYFNPPLVIRDPLSRVDIYSDRSFGPNHPPGVSLNSYLFTSQRGNDLPKPVEESNAQKRVGEPLVGIGFPDTVKGKTLFICVIQKSSGQTLVDSSYVILQ